MVADSIAQVFALSKILAWDVETVGEVGQHCHGLITNGMDFYVYRRHDPFFKKGVNCNLKKSQLDNV